MNKKKSELQQRKEKASEDWALDGQEQEKPRENRMNEVNIEASVKRKTTTHNGLHVEVC